MKKPLLISMGMGVAAFGGLLCRQPAADAPLQAAQLPKAVALLPAVAATGLVGAGEAIPLLARTAGQVEDVFFASGEYARRGQLLAKLTNHSFIIAPRAGFLGLRQLAYGQYITATTQVTTLSRYSHLVVSVRLPEAWRGNVHAGDSVQVWVPARPDRVVSGVVGPLEAAGSTSEVEILLTSRAPFRIGERASIGLPRNHRVAIAH